jgi:hypothetical protein
LAFTPRTVASWCSAQARPASSNNFATVLMDTPVRRETERMDETLAEQGEDLGAGAGRELVHARHDMNFHA